MALEHYHQSSKDTTAIFDNNFAIPGWSIRETNKHFVRANRSYEYQYSDFMDILHHYSGSHGKIDSSIQQRQHEEETDNDRGI